MLTNTSNGIVDWLKENKRGITFQFRHKNVSDWAIYIREDLLEEENTFLYEIGVIEENKFKIYNRQVTFNGHSIHFNDFEEDNDLYLKKTVGAVREKDLEKFTKFYVNKIKWAKKLYKENLIKNICKEDVDD